MFRFRPGGASEPEAKQQLAGNENTTSRKRTKQRAGNETRTSRKRTTTGTGQGSHKRAPKTMFFGFSTRNAAECDGYRLKRTSVKPFRTILGSAARKAKVLAARRAKVSQAVQASTQKRGCGTEGKSFRFPHGSPKVASFFLDVSPMAEMLLSVGVRYHYVVVP